ncbi:hypothetical protein [Synechococcus sp. 1G10]|uniref:hypothetical protein n=1 Tax=Synechococcus sp. 1G10 TaxID=2025605 RepID=UPI00117F7911|nr:hypothetical protein [Synechococcus sp. 1G10]
MREFSKTTNGELSRLPWELLDHLAATNLVCAKPHNNKRIAMAKALNRDQLVDIRDAFFDLISWSLTRRDTLENQGIITRQESDMIGQFEDQLRLIADALNSVILRQVIADIDEPRNRIVAVTKDLEAAIGTLQSLNDFIGVLD